MEQQTMGDVKHAKEAKNHRKKKKHKPDIDCKKKKTKKKKFTNNKTKNYCPKLQILIAIIN